MSWPSSIAESVHVWAHSLLGIIFHQYKIQYYNSRGQGAVREGEVQQTCATQSYAKQGNYTPHYTETVHALLWTILFMVQAHILINRGIPPCTVRWIAQLALTNMC